MERLSKILLLGSLASLALAERGSESGGGIAPWAGSGPEPAPRARPSAAKIAAFSAESDQAESPLRAVSSVPVGQIISRCTVPGTVALTFDDGPYIYTAQVLDTLRNNGVPATFFINGANWRNVLEPEGQRLVQRTAAEGHQIGSHTWSHPDLATLDRNGIVDQMQKLESALLQILGRYPTYMRPPYFSTNSLVLQTMGELGYHVIHADIDTLDWANDSEGGIQTSIQRFIDGLNSGGSIALSHDVHQWTANRLVQAMIDEVRRRGLRAVTVGDCLGDPRDAWYRT